MELIVLPYMAISLLIGWTVFAPFAEIEELDEWTFAKIEISDILAIFLPICAILALSTWLFQATSTSFITMTLIAVTILLFILFAFVTGLFLLAKMDKPPASKRMATIGIIIPLGTVLSLAWIIFPMLAFAGAGFFALPATLALIPITLMLRVMSAWVCKRA